MYSKIKKQKVCPSKLQKSGGFTLIEMITVVAIFGLVSAIVLTNYNNFTNGSLLTNMSYEMALSIREAQTFGVAVANRSSSDFDNSFGIHFTAPSDGSGSSAYYLYEDLNGNRSFDTSPADETKQEYVLQRNIKIVRLETDTNCSKSPSELSILFDRPNPEPKIGGDPDDPGARITLETSDGIIRYVIVRSNGQIYVDSDSTCPF